MSHAARWEHAVFVSYLLTIETQMSCLGGHDPQTEVFGSHDLWLFKIL